MNTQRRAKAVVSVLLIAASACQPRMLRRDIRPIQPRTGSIPGIEAALENNHAVRVLLIHGMGQGDADTVFGVPWQFALVKELGGNGYKFKADPVVTTIPIARGYSWSVSDGHSAFHDSVFVDSLSGAVVRAGSPGSKYVAASELTSKLRITRYQRINSARPDSLVMYQLFWAPYMNVVKRRYFACFEAGDPSLINGCPGVAPDDPAKNIDARALGNAQLKDMLLINGLGDAAVVMSPLGDVLRDDLDLAMCLLMLDANRPLQAGVDGRRRCSYDQTSSGRMLRAALDTATAADRVRMIRIANGTGMGSLFVLTHSLGSFLIMDGQMRAARPVVSDSSAGKNRLDSLIQARPYLALDSATVFMMANQIGLIGLSRLGVVCSTTGAGACTCPNAAQCAKPPVPPPTASIRTRYVAFNNHDDLLDFELQPFLRQSLPAATLVNVSIRTECTRFFGAAVLTFPGCAHTRYYESHAMRDAIVSGIELDKPPGGLGEFLGNLRSDVKLFLGTQVFHSPGSRHPRGWLEFGTDYLWRPSGREGTPTLGTPRIRLGAAPMCQSERSGERRDFLTYGAAVGVLGFLDLMYDRTANVSPGCVVPSQSVTIGLRLLEAFPTTNCSMLFLTTCPGIRLEVAPPRWQKFEDGNRRYVTTRTSLSIYWRPW